MLADEAKAVPAAAEQGQPARRLVERSAVRNGRRFMGSDVNEREC